MHINILSPQETKGSSPETQGLLSHGEGEGHMSGVCCTYLYSCSVDGAGGLGQHAVLADMEATRGKDGTGPGKAWEKTCLIMASIQQRKQVQGL